MQTILGSTGSIGTELAKELRKYTFDIRLVSRNPKKVNDGDLLLTANLLNENEVERAVEGSSIVYLTVGLEYKTKIWQEYWPKLIQYCINACKRNNARLVFFDNVYVIGGDNVKHITEESPISPVSKKGQVRAEVYNLIMKAVEKNDVKVIIARAPDFFGTNIKTSMLMNIVYLPFSKGKKAQWFCGLDYVHTMGYVPDLAAGTAILGNSPDGWNRVWNLPTDKEALTGRQWISLFAQEMGVADKATVIPALAVKLLGLFVPVLAETYEMLYQYDRDYYFDSSRFCKQFNYTPKSNAEAVKETLGLLRSARSE